ncbi:MAG: hypothetical protein ACFFAN_14445 [Promethearchaeota archaeon]
MSTMNISKKLKKKILSIALNIDNNYMRILYILRNLGSQRFTSLIELSGLSRSTVSKYLKLHMEQNNIEKKIFKNKDNDSQEQRYIITELGIEKLNEEPSKNKEIFAITELNNSISKLTNLIEFFKEIGVDKSIYFQIIRIISKIGNNFFLLEQTRELYLTLFYMFYNSILGQGDFAYKHWRIEQSQKEKIPENPFTGYKLNINQFCEVYKVKKLYIDFYLDKIMSSNLGFYMFVRGKDAFFFHEEDLLGTATLRLIKDHLIEEVIHINLIGYKKIYDLDKMAEDVAEQLKKMNLIWDETHPIFYMGIQEEFEMLIEKLIIKTAVDMGISKTFLMDIVIQSEKLLKSKEGINSLINIINGSERYEDLNIVSISEKEDKNLDEIISQIQGFCPNCGKIVLKQDLSKECSKCNERFEFQDLLKKIDEATEASKRFKQKTLQKEELMKCPNSECDANVLSNWERCPVCLKDLKKNNKS